MKASIYLILLATLLFSCAPDDSHEREEALKEEIMDIHNSLMPKMDNLDTLKQKLRDNSYIITTDTLAQTIEKTNEASMDSLVQALETADENMTNWMKNYGEFDNDAFTHEEQMQYLRDEKEKIEAVRLEVISAIMEAENILKVNGIVP